MSVRSSGWVVSFRFFISLLIFRLLALSVTERSVWKSSTINADYPVSPSHSNRFCFICFEVLFLDAYAFRIVTSSC